MAILRVRPTMTISAPSAPPTLTARLVSDGKAEIPWGYGKDRVTAMVVDPESLCVYWEVTDEALARERAEPGGVGPRAALVLRVCDTTGRLYDGTNAHSWFDQRIERADRQWFAQVGKPGSSAVVELGLLGDGGQFRALCRSGRVDFPRAAAAPVRAVEWMTVRAASGTIDEQHVDPSDASVDFGGPGAPSAAQQHGEGEPPEALDPERWLSDSRESRLDHRESWSMDNQEGMHIVWEEAGGATHYTWQGSTGSWEEQQGTTSWVAGPFPYPVTVVPPTLEQLEGETKTHQVGGELRVVTGPWQVVIRGLGAYASRRVLARWEVRRTVASHGVTQRLNERAAPIGSSRGGASELTLRGHSELRLSGASEVYYLGASERRRRGASERLLRGASERLLRGASERLLRGASERLGNGSGLGSGSGGGRSPTRTNLNLSPKK